MVRGPVSMILVGLVTLAMFALVTLGPRGLDKVLPEGAIAWLETMGGSGVMTMAGGADTVANPEDPASYLRDSSDGWRPRGPIAALPGGGVAFIDAVIDGYSVRVKGDAPAQTEPLTPLAGCTPTPPSAGAVVAHVRASASGDQPLGLATYGDAALAEAVQVFAAHYRQTGLKQRARLGGLAFQAYDVAVTETARPVYLVLDSGWFSMRIFNVHLAPGARLERIVLLGGDQAGVANVAADVPVEVLRNPEMQACGLFPFYPLNPGHLFYQSVENGAIPAEEATAKAAQFTAQSDAWDAAFRAMFGVGAIQTVSGDWHEGTLSVAGPVPATPEARPVWQPIQGSTVRLTLDQYVDHPGLAETGTDFAATVEAIATAFAWGDLKNLKRGVQF